MALPYQDESSAFVKGTLHLERTSLPTACLLLEDGSHIKGYGVGAIGTAIGELCFNTAMTGYQEILTDPSYAGQILVFTFPHIGNIGTTTEDTETASNINSPLVRGCVIRARVGTPSNWRAQKRLDHWLKARGIVGISGVDTRALTTILREKGALNGIIAHTPQGLFDLAALHEELKAWPGLLGMDLAREVSCLERYNWKQGQWTLEGYTSPVQEPKHHVVVIDYGVKANILRCLVEAGNRVTVVPALASDEEIFALNPDGILLSNGPGDPAATGAYAVPQIKKLLASGLPIFGICLGHQMLALALGAKTIKMHQGHHGANHPVKECATGRVMITSMNHGFAVDRTSLPAGVIETHTSLFDGSNCGISVIDKPVFSVQHHPEASPGPQDSFGLFSRFSEIMEAYKHGSAKRL